MTHNPGNGHGSLRAFFSTAAPYAAIALLFVAVRSILIGFTGAVEVDSVRYVSLGRLWAEGDWRRALDSEYHPLYPFLLGLFLAPFRDPELPGRVLSVLFSAATLAPVGWIGWMLGGRACALASLFIFAILPHPWRASVEILSEPLYLLLFACECALAVRCLKSWDWRHAAAAGLFAGAAYLTRPEGFLPLLALIPVAALPGREAPKAWKRVLTAAAAIPAFLLVAGPYMAAIGAVTAKKRVSRLAGSGEYSPQDSRRPSFTRAAAPEAPPDRSDISGGAAPDGSGPQHAPGRPDPEPDISREPDLSAWEIAGKDPDHISREKPVKSPFRSASYLFLMAGHFISPFFVIAGFALARVALKPWRPDLFLFAVAAGSFALVLALLLAYRYASLRHALPFTVLTIPVAAVGFLELWRAAGGWQPRPARGFLLLCATAFALFFFCQGFRPLRYPKKAIKTAAAALREKSAPGDVFFSDDPRYSFYAGRGFLGLGMMSLDEFEAVVGERKPRFLVADRPELDRRVPGFAESAESRGWRRIELGVDESSSFVPLAFERLLEGGGP